MDGDKGPDESAFGGYAVRSIFILDYAGGGAGIAAWMHGSSHN